MVKILLTRASFIPKHECGLLELLNFPFQSRLSSSFAPKRTLDISGIFPPIITPFQEGTGRIDYDNVQYNFNQWNQVPFKGYVVLGSNGEPVAISRAEKIELLKQVRKFAKKDAIIIAGLGGNGTQETVELCQEVGDEKTADAALIITPFFYKNQMTDLALEKHFVSVADRSPIPIILYSVPANANIDMSVDLVTTLSTHPNIIGLKDSGGDITKISRIVNQTRENGFQVLAGSAGFLLPALLMGCVGGVCALANVLGYEVCQLYQHFRQGNYAEAVELQRRLILPNSMVTQKHGVAGLKHGMDLLNLRGGPTRAPLLQLTSSQKQELENVFTLFIRSK